MVNLRRIVDGIVGLSMIAGATTGLIRISPGYEHMSSYKQAQVIADVDRNNRTSAEEWTQVYEKLGVQERRWVGFDLSTEQLNKYTKDNS